MASTDEMIAEREMEELVEKMKRLHARIQKREETFQQRSWNKALGRSRCRQLISECTHDGGDGIVSRQGNYLYSLPYEVKVNCAKEYISGVEGFKIHWRDDPK